MKVSVIIIIFSTGLCCCISNAAKTDRDANANASKMTDTVNYNTEVLPILIKKCSPCHFAGGKMYEKMPFDNSSTILGHGTGILKRIKDQPDAALIKKFIQQSSKGNNH